MDDGSKEKTEVGAPNTEETVQQSENQAEAKPKVESPPKSIIDSTIDQLMNNGNGNQNNQNQQPEVTNEITEEQKAVTDKTNQSVE